MNKDTYIVHKVGLIVILIILAIVILPEFFSGDNNYDEISEDGTYNVQQVDSLEKFEPPLIRDITGKSKIIFEDIQVDLTYVARYTISGRVVNASDYNAAEGVILNKVMPKDIGIGWGVLSDKKSDKNLTWVETFNRDLSVKIRKAKWAQSVGGIEELERSYTNLHLIVDESMRDQVKKINKNDFVKMDGYLVNIYYETSTLNMDFGVTQESVTGNPKYGKLFYITDITWLKK